MCSPRCERVLTIAVDCNDRPWAAIYPSALAESAYGCEKGHMRLIVAGPKRQNESKSLQNKGIGQSKKKVKGRISAGTSRNSANPRVSRGKRLVGWGGYEPKGRANAAQERPNDAGSFPSRTPVRLNDPRHARQRDRRVGEFHVPVILGRRQVFLRVERHFPGDLLAGVRVQPAHDVQQRALGHVLAVVDRLASADRREQFVVLFLVEVVVGSLE